MRRLPIVLNPGHRATCADRACPAPRRNSSDVSAIEFWDSTVVSQVRETCGRVVGQDGVGWRVYQRMRVLLRYRFRACNEKMNAVTAVAEILESLP